MTVLHNVMSDITIGLDYQEFFIRCVVAIVCGLVIGLERQLNGHAIGIKTTILLSLGSCIFVLFGYSDSAMDGARMAAAVVTGIGFLCSGSIFRGGMTVKGINTSTTIWISGGVGCLASTGNYGGCIIATVLVVLANLSTYKLAKWLPGDGGNGTIKTEHAFQFQIPYDKERIKELRNKILDMDKRGYIITELSEKNGVLKAELTFIGIPNAKKAEKLIEEFSEFTNGKGISWKLSK